MPQTQCLLNYLTGDKSEKSGSHEPQLYSFKEENTGGKKKAEKSARSI